MNKQVMDINSFVMNNYQGIIRYGTVTRKLVKADGWAYYEVEWYDDISYMESVAWRNSLNNKENGVTQYRGDMLVHIPDPKRIANCVGAHLGFLTRKIKTLINSKNEMKRIDVFSMGNQA